MTESKVSELEEVIDNIRDKTLISSSCMVELVGVLDNTKNTYKIVPTIRET